jgi:hypothetical protein
MSIIQEIEKEAKLSGQGQSVKMAGSWRSDPYSTAHAATDKKGTK